ncbi:5-formyltetrahydrofolate cyclo-ligase [Methylobacterium sp. 4-46]|uniref:5-formyltetrahydrofolate cyclo-ligase n=1 Tax=unclassified Methylobacterium TaxID=2615210 RepID=UPI000165C7A3|nr:MULTISPECIES: 5-formyltetrahydrofolate cyclo-ligase [Methylobacterium]ACA17482.1 5-formyltetrahydrofolate cyclo-ligase [Methylobacterium sp. 4-46]WFT83166.1 5-formyltetrahydrofolate cyclo-ligase [Methylobacterium nodulans]
MTDDILVPTDKASLRREALARRDGLDAAYRAEASRRIAEAVLALPALAGAGLVSAYWPIRSEVDVRPLIAALRDRGQAVALPQVTPAGLVFRQVAEDDALSAGGFGLSEPGPEAAEVRPRALLVPLAAFDRRLHRIGYGKGYYDRALADLSRDGPILTVGVAFAVQEIAQVPEGPHDHSLDHIVTEAGVIGPATSPSLPAGV